MKRNRTNTLLTFIIIIIISAIYSQCSQSTTEQSPAPTSVPKAIPEKKPEAVTKGLEIPASESSSKEHIISRFAYTLSYNESTRNPNWVAWSLTAAHTNGEFNRNGIKFAEDEDVAEPRATNMDYTRSGYDRGHMCPSGDNKWSERAQRESFIYTNCCPQLHALNDGNWNELESRCRKWAKEYGEVFIVCGPLYTSKRHKTIGKNKIAVPEAFFKVILRMGDQPAAIGFTMRNINEDQPLQQNVHSIDEIEQLTGIDFFPALDDKTERKVEATADLSQWK